MNAIENELRNWDGVHIESLLNLYNSYSRTDSFFIELLGLLKESPELEIPISWLIKNHFDEGFYLSETEIDLLLDEVLKLSNWAAQLHIMQIIPKIEITEKNYTTLFTFVENGLTSDAKFVRAWAYQGYYELSQFNNHLKPKLRLLCENGLLSESASVRSRIKRILNALK